MPEWNCKGYQGICRLKMLDMSFTQSEAPGIRREAWKQRIPPWVWSNQGKIHSTWLEEVPGEKRDPESFWGSEDSQAKVETSPSCLSSFRGQDRRARTFGGTELGGGRDGEGEASNSGFLLLRFLPALDSMKLERVSPGCVTPLTCSQIIGG